MNSVRKIIMEPQHIDHCLKWVDHNATKALNAGAKIYVEIGVDEGDKTSEQNKKEHALIKDINDQAVIKMIGKRIEMRSYTFNACKALLVVWFAREMELLGEPLKKPPETVDCPISGERITVRPSVTDFGKKVESKWIEWLYATGSQAGVKWTEQALKEYERYSEYAKG
jgi:hypothetical protein